MLSYRPASLKSHHKNEIMISPTYESEEQPLVHLEYSLCDIISSIPIVQNTL